MRARGLLLIVCLLSALRPAAQAAEGPEIPDSLKFTTVVTKYDGQGDVVVHADDTHRTIDRMTADLLRLQSWIIALTRESGHLVIEQQKLEEIPAGSSVKGTLIHDLRNGKRRWLIEYIPPATVGPPETLTGAVVAAR